MSNNIKRINYFATFLFPEHLSAVSFGIMLLVLFWSFLVRRRNAMLLS